MRKRSQAGFTLLEVMIASVASMAVLMPALVFMRNAYDWYASVQSELMLNREARHVLDLIGNGARAATNGNDGTPNIYGIRGRKAAPSANSLRSNYKLQYVSNNLTVTGDALPSQTISCTAAARPLPDCSSAGQNKTVTGWIGDSFKVTASARAIASRTVEVTVTLTDPFQAQRAANPATATQTYRTLFTLNLDAGDP